MDDHRAANVRDLHLRNKDGLVEGVCKRLNNGHGQELHGGRAAKHGAHADEDGSGAKVARDKVANVHLDLALPLVLEDAVQERHNNHAQLHGEPSHKKVEPNRAPCKLAQKRHQESKANKHHHVHVPPHSTRESKTRTKKKTNKNKTKNKKNKDKWEERETERESE